MKIVTEQPTEGNFIMLWPFNNHIWAQECKWQDNKLLEYDAEKDKWVPYWNVHPAATHYVIQ